MDRHLSVLTLYCPMATVLVKNGLSYRHLSSQNKIIPFYLAIFPTCEDP